MLTQWESIIETPPSFLHWQEPAADIRFLQRQGNQSWGGTELDGESQKKAHPDTGQLSLLFWKSLCPGLTLSPCVT